MVGSLFKIEIKEGESRFFFFCIWEWAEGIGDGLKGDIIYLVGVRDILGV